MTTELNGLDEFNNISKPAHSRGGLSRVVLRTPEGVISASVYSESQVVTTS